MFETLIPTSVNYSSFGVFLLQAHVSYICAKFHLCSLDDLV